VPIKLADIADMATYEAGRHNMSAAATLAAKAAQRDGQWSVLAAAYRSEATLYEQGGAAFVTLQSGIRTPRAPGETRAEQMARIGQEDRNHRQANDLLARLQHQAQSVEATIASECRSATD
jgi:hypothetical protein